MGRRIVAHKQLGNQDAPRHGMQPCTCSWLSSARGYGFQTPTPSSLRSPANDEGLSVKALQSCTVVRVRGGSRARDSMQRRRFHDRSSVWRAVRPTMLSASCSQVRSRRRGAPGLPREGAAGDSDGVECHSPSNMRERRRVTMASHKSCASVPACYLRLVPGAPL